MRFKVAFAAVVAALSVSLLGAAGASAATEFGDTCSGTDPAVGPYTVTTLSAPPAALPLSAPTSGVITKVKMQLEAGLPISLPQAVKVLRPAGGNSFTTIGETTIQVETGLTVADARLPVRAGDRLGVLGLPFTYEGTPLEGVSFFCKVPGDLGATDSPTPVGATADYPREAEGRVPLAAIVEPDADNDGFGDETQDQCPQNAAVQNACPVGPPVVTLSASANARKRLATVFVTSNAQASVTVAGTVTLGKGKMASLNGGTQIVAPGTLAKFTLLFPQKLKSKLQQLSRKRSLVLKLTSTAPNAAGPPAVSQLSLRLKGQAKPKPKPKKSRR